MNTAHRGWTDPGVRRIAILSLITLSALVLSAGQALAHNVTEGDAGYIQEIWGVNIIPFMYLGAKHMVTGYDHILFLLGVVFFLYRMKDVAIYVSIFALGHSVTMLAGVWWGWGINAYIIDAIIGLSVVYKALDNLGAYQRWFGVQPNTKAATLIFGLFHGTGLATKILDYEIASRTGCSPIFGVQRRRRDRSAARARRDPHRHELLAKIAVLLPPGLHRQCRHDVHGVHPHGVANHRLLRSRLRKKTGDPNVQRRKTEP